VVKRNSWHQHRLRARVAATRAACHICGNPIDYALPHTDPHSFVIDHVIPLAKGGHDSIENVRAAHRQCNRAKGARDTAPIIRRSGALD
jgi:5-methylcytosine-specific restriction endonuclease McrA